MSNGAILAFALLAPLLGAGLIAFLDRWPKVREAINLLSAFSLFSLVLILLRHFNTGDSIAFSFLEVMPGLQLSLMVEPLGLLFASVASSLWIITSIYTIGYMRAHREEHRTRFCTFFALTIAAAIGIAFAGNCFTLFIFYEMMTLVTYPLVTHHGTEDAMKAGRIYLGYLFGTSVAFFLLAITWTWFLAGTLDFKAGGILTGKAGNTTLLVLLALYVFGIGKAALMPFHRWLPAAMVAPAPVSALLHAVAVVKAGVFSVMKIVVYVFGIDFLHETGLSVWLMYVSAATILIASLIALTKDNLKERLAYSTVSQLSYIVLGAALANAWGVIGGSMHIIMHAFGKITLFFCAGAIDVATHKTKISEMSQIGKIMPVTMTAFLIGSLSVIGLPPFGGSWSKWYLIMGAVSSGHAILVGVLILSSLLNIAYLMPVVIRAFFIGPSNPTGETKVKEAPLTCVIPLCITAFGCLVLFFFANDLYQFLSRLVHPDPTLISSGNFP
jgi:multicomponent Na+:H+ antiporter subunit D